MILEGVVEVVVLCKNLGERRCRVLNGEEVEEEVGYTFLDEECEECRDLREECTGDRQNMEVVTEEDREEKHSSMAWPIQNSFESYFNRGQKHHNRFFWI